jgi:hypothetical protein
LSATLEIEASDNAGRWYLLPGAENAFSLKLLNRSDHSILCKLNLDEPAGAGALSPASMTLNAGESRNVSLTFKPEWLTLRDRKVVVSARNAAGSVLATFVHDLVSATTTDCSVSLAWKDEIVGDGAIRGFMLTCTLRSISSTPGVFEPEFAPHPSLQFPEKQRITLGPGESSTFDVPIVWNRSARDAEGWNHPRTIEVNIAVTHGRRSASAPWDTVQQHIEPYLTDADKAPILARRPPPMQFTTPGGGLATLPAAPAQPVPILSPVVMETPAARIERSEMEAGVAAGSSLAPAPLGMRLPQQSAPPAPVVRTNREIVAVSRGTLVLIAAAFGAVVIAILWFLRPVSNTTATYSIVTPLPVAATPLRAKPFVRHQPVKTKPKPHGSPAPAHSAAPVAAVAAAVAQPAQARAAATTAPSQQHSTVQTHAASQRHATAPVRMSPVDRSALVQLGDVDAEYLHGGRMVHVTWDSYAQSSADIQVLNASNTLLAETTVGRREASTLWLPRGYRGTLYVQVTAIGYNGERVESSTTLPGY